MTGAAVRAEAMPRRQLLIGCLAVGVGLVARVLILSRNAPLWGDEAMLAVGSLRTGLPGIVRPLDYLQLAPPLYLLALKLGAACLGHAEWALRLPALLAGMVTIWLVFRVGLLISGLEFASTAALLASLTPMLLRYSAEVKPYALDALFGIGIVYVVLRLGSHPPHSPRLFLTAWLMAMTLGSIAAPVLVGGLLLAIALLPTARRRVGWSMLAIAALLTATIYVVCYLTIYRVNATAPPMTGFWSESYLSFGTPGVLERVRYTLQSLASTLPSFAPLAREFRTVLVIIGGAMLLPKRPGLRTSLTLPTLLALGLSAVGVFPIAPRLLLFVQPALLLCLAQIITALIPRPDRDRRRTWWTVAILSAAALPALRMLPFVTPLALFLILALLALLMAPRLPRRLLPLLSAGIAVVLTGRQALSQIRHPVIEDGRETITALLSQPVSAVYIPAASAPAWLYYSSARLSTDRARVEWYVRRAHADDAAVPFSDDPGAIPARGAEAWRGPRRVEILGTWPGVVYRPPRGFITGPRPGWAAAEASDISALDGNRLVIVETHRLPGATEALLGSLQRLHWQLDSVTGERTAQAVFLHRSSAGTSP